MKSICFPLMMEHMIDHWYSTCILLIFMFQITLLRFLRAREFDVDGAYRYCLTEFVYTKLEPVHQFR